jgi:hypothetical protein
MIKKHKYWTISILLVTVILLGTAVPLYLRSLGQAELETGSFTDQPETSPHIPLSSEIIPRTGAVEVASVEPELANCTYPVHYWQVKPETWPAQVSLSGQIYTKETIRDIFLVEDPDSHTRLIQHVYTAFLNILHGADMVAIETTLLNAQKWLEDNPPGSQLSEFNLRQARDMTQVLIHYNNGEIGPGACADAPEPPQPTLVPTAMVEKDIPEVVSRPQPASPAVPPAPRQPLQAPAQPVSPTDPPPPPPPTNPPPPPPTDPPPPPPPTNPPPPPPTDTPPPPPPTNTPVPPPTDTPPPPPPTNTPVPPPTNTPPPPPNPPGPPNQHPQGLALANKYGVSYEEIMGWNDQGFGFGEIDQAYAMSQETGAPVATIFEMRASGMGWGQIRRALRP